MIEKTMDLESIEDQQERMDYEEKIMDATDKMINRDPDFWDKIDQFKRSKDRGIMWLK